MGLRPEYREAFEAFRATLPPGGQDEVFEWSDPKDPSGVIEWNVVFGLWICRVLRPRPPRPLARAEIVRLARHWGLAYKKGGQAPRDCFQEADFLAILDQYSLEEPGLLGSRQGFQDGTLLLDGHHRLRKAFLSRRPMSVYVLTEEETRTIEGLFLPRLKRWSRPPA